MKLKAYLSLVFCYPKYNLNWYTSNMKLLIFAFKNTIASRVLEGLSCPNKIIINSDEQSIYRLVKQVEDFDRVLGLGEYSGRDKDRLRKVLD